MLKKLLVAAAASALLAGCPGASPTSASSYATPAAAGGLSGLLSQDSNAQSTLAALLNQSPDLAFPVRVGVVYYQYSDPLRPEDNQRVLSQLGTDLTASGLVRSSIVVPAGLVAANSSVDQIRTLAARFQVDVALIISGANRVQLAAAQPQGLFSNAVAYESRSSLNCLALGVLTGTFLSPIDGVGKAGPVIVDPTDPSLNAQQYTAVLSAHTDALNALKTQFLASLTAIKEAEATATPAPPTPAPTATPTPATDPAATAAAN